MRQGPQTNLKILGFKMAFTFAHECLVKEIPELGETFEDGWIVTVVVEITVGVDGIRDATLKELIFPEGRDIAEFLLTNVASDIAWRMVEVWNEQMGHEPDSMWLAKCYKENQLDEGA